jgi:hypothetical protein
VAPHKKKKKFTSKPRTKKQKRLFDEITETLRRARVLAAKTALPKLKKGSSIDISRNASKALTREGIREI